MPLTREAALALWDRAAAAEIGTAIVEKTNNKRALQNMLYAVRAETNDPKHANLVITLPADSDEVWIVKKTVEMPSDA